MDYYKVPGLSIAMVEGGKIQWAKGYGYICYDTAREVDETTMFQAASISKPVAALMALKLVEEGKLDLDSDVNNYLKDWKIETNNSPAKNLLPLEDYLPILRD
jgi:CubicO group peptidase (beta-lactamase class C family)